MFFYENCFSGLSAEPVDRNQPLKLVRKLVYAHSDFQTIDFYYVWIYKPKGGTLSFKSELAADFEIKDLTNGDNWRWHHVIPNTHVRSLFSAADAYKIISYQMPCVLINQQTEHNDYNLFSGPTFRIIANLPTSRVKVESNDRPAYIKKIRQHIKLVYHNPVIQKLAFNILDNF